MSKLPIRRPQLDLQQFCVWLSENGAEIGKLTNPYEVVRYRAYSLTAHKAAIHIVYAKENGLLTWTGKSREHYEAFLAGERIAGMFVSQFDALPPNTPARESKTKVESSAEKRRRKLLARDGNGCWFCGLAMGSDCTIEHLIPRSRGGMDSLINFALAHKACNHKAADMPLIQKIEMRNKMRAGEMV